MKQVLRIIVPVALVSLFLGCAGSSDGPRQVAHNFWSAAKEGDLDEAKRYATEASMESVRLTGDGGEKGEVSFGEESMDGDRAMVATTLISEEGGMKGSVQLQTVLVREGGEWKVDFDQTMMSMFGGAMGEMMENMGEAMEQGMAQMADQMEQSMQQMGQPE